MGCFLMVTSTRRKICLLLALFIIITLSFSRASAAELVVPDRYRSIQEAVESANEGDTVVIRGGEYRENIAVNRPLTVRGESTSGAVIITAATPSEPVITVKGVAGATIIGITVTGSGIAGIYIVDSREIKILNTNAAGNRYGIHLDRSVSSTLDGNSAGENEYGIYLSRSSDNIVKGNGADGNSDKGIVLVESHRNSVVENSATGNYWDGISLFAAIGNRIRGNKIWKNTFAIVNNTSDENDIADNSKMRRLYFILPVVLVYLGIIIYFVEKRLFYLFLTGPKKKRSKQMGRFGGGG
ncbi:MAG: nitrous oxide reductase family maturation protein NosD [Thermodesulfobacteriota bacterium]